MSANNFDIIFIPDEDGTAKTEACQNVKQLLRAGWDILAVNVRADRSGNDVVLIEPAIFIPPTEENKQALKQALSSKTVMIAEG